MPVLREGINASTEKWFPRTLSSRIGVLGAKTRCSHEPEPEGQAQNRRRPSDRGRHRPGQARRAKGPSVAPAGAADAPGEGANADRSRSGDLLPSAVGPGDADGPSVFVLFDH